MQIINVLLARVIWFADLQLINPSGLALGPVQAALRERYKFLIYPSSPQEFDMTKGVRYADGEFVFDGKTIGVAISIFNNGWATDTFVSTEASEAFLNDLVEWLTIGGFRPPQDFVTKIVYESQLVVHSKTNLRKTFDSFRSFEQLIAELSGNPTEQLIGFYIGGDNPQLSTFTFERRQNTPFSENKYFSRAALPTSKHIQALDELEKILT